jgi:putative ABC transport system permease protein
MTERLRRLRAAVVRCAALVRRARRERELGDEIESHLRLHIVVSRVGGALATIVAAFGLLLACLGVYGLVGYRVSQRTREIGIRMALGAQRVQVLDLVVRDGFRPVLGGLVLGLAMSAVNARVLASRLYGLAALDPISFAGASLTLVAGLAIWIPARRPRAWIRSPR